jgi:hypothetical protein
MRLGAPLRGVVYGFALIVAAPVAWQSGEQKAALFMGAVAHADVHVSGCLYPGVDSGAD